MGRPKRTSPAAEKATLRAAGLAAISPTLDLGNGATLVAYNTAIEGITKAVTGKLAVYNATLALADQQLNDLLAAEKAINTLSDTMLTGVAFKYGKDSNEYEKAGGTRVSERKSPARKPKPAKPA
jgi:hypothetical protein